MLNVQSRSQHNLTCDSSSVDSATAKKITAFLSGGVHEIQPPKPACKNGQQPDNEEGCGERKPTLDFIIIGSQKCGTTSLHKYLQPHPEIYMLPEKEVPYFTNADYCEKGWEWYLKEFFAERTEGTLCGKSTPQYMTRTETPRKIYEQIPNVKLIALLRNPIERAYSQYRMNLKMETENRDFLEIIKEKLQPEVLEREREAPQKTNARAYLVIGEYGRLLEEYYKVFPKEQLLVLFTEDLAANTKAVVKQVFSFLGVDSNFVPPNVEKHYHVGGAKRRIPLDEQSLAKHFLFQKFLLLLPRRARHAFARRFLFWYMIWNTRPDSGMSQLPREARAILSRFYKDDVRKLEELLGRKVPWPEFK
jgi:Sulfotransferase domain